LEALANGEMTRRGVLVRAGTTAAATAAAGALTLGAPAAAAVAAPVEQAAGNTLRLVLGTDPESIDPQKASFVNEIEIIMRVYRNLLQFDANTNLVPDLAADMPVVTDNGTTLTFTLKPNLRFSDGTSLTAQHFEYGWKRHLDPKVAGEYAFTGYIIAGGQDYSTANLKTVTDDQLQTLRDAVGVKALDDQTLQFKLKAAAPWFLPVLATWNGVPVRQELITAGNGGNDTDSKWTDDPAYFVGSGPYILTVWEKQNRLAFRANPSYTFGAPPIANVEYAIINEPAVQFASYLNGELDVVGVQIEDRPRIDSDPTLKAQFQEFPGRCSYYMGLSTIKSPMDNLNVRQALSYGFDRVSYVRNILGGAGLAARQLLPPGFPGYYETELEEQIFNPDIGKTKLTQAGYPGGRGLPQITLEYRSDARTKTRAEAIQNIYQQTLGININLQPVEAKELVARRKKNDTYPQMVLGGWCQDYPDPQDWYTTVFNSKGTVEHNGWKNAQFDTLTEQADIQQDPGIRRELYRQAAQILLTETPVFMMYWAVVWQLVSPRVQGFITDPLENFVGEHSLYNLTLAG